MTQASLVIAAAALHAGGAVAQNYPNRPIRVIIPASPGDSCDTLSRLVGQKVGERLGQQLAVDNREMNHAMPLPDVRKKLTAFGLEIHTEPPEYFTEVIRRDFDKWGKLVREIGFKAS